MINIMFIIKEFINSVETEKK